MKRSAFTLVELLIVMAVIAALISVVAPMGLNALKQARTVQVAGDFRGAMQEVIGLVAAYGKTDGVEVDVSVYGTPFDVDIPATGTLVTITATGTGFDRSKYDGKYIQGALQNSRTSTTFDSETFKLTFSVASYIYN